MVDRACHPFHLASDCLCGTGRVSNGPASFFISRSTRRLATWAGVVVGSRRMATRVAHLWQAHRHIAEAGGMAIRAKRTEQNRRTSKCPLMAMSGPSDGLRFTSALPPKADIREGAAKRLLMTQSGH